jgi:Holliday junction resolvase
VANSRAKGYRGEAELVKLYESHGFVAKRTAAMQAGDDEHFPDVTAYGETFALTIANECKNRKSLPGATLTKAMNQVDSAYGSDENVVRVVAMRVQGSPGEWVFAMRGSTFFSLLERIKPERKISK